MMKPEDLREMTNEELLTKLADLREELFKLRFQATTGQLENTSRIGETRREIAQVLTIQRSKQLAEQAGSVES